MKSQVSFIRGDEEVYNIKKSIALTLYFFPKIQLFFIKYISFPLTCNRLIIFKYINK